MKTGQWIGILWMSFGTATALLFGHEMFGSAEFVAGALFFISDV